MQSVKNKIRTMLMRLCKFALLLVACISSLRAGGEANEYKIKAMFVLNFIKYVEWPNDNGSNIIRIGIIGKTEMYEALKGMTANMNEGRQIKIEEVTEENKDVF